MDDEETTATERARRADVERFVYGERDHRFTQSSPITLDAWTQLALEWPRPCDLLLIPNFESTAGRLARMLAHRLRDDELRQSPGNASGASAVVARAGIVATQAAVAARLTFRQLLRAALPMTRWWHEYLYAGVRRPGTPPKPPKIEPGDPADLFSSTRPLPGVREAMIAMLRGGPEAPPAPTPGAPQYLLRDGLRWLIRVAGGIALLSVISPEKSPTDEQWQQWLEARERSGLVVDALLALLRDVAAPASGQNGQPLWAVHSNRPAETAIRRSMATVKADAARHVFDVKGKDIRWAVIDTGIDATHRAFRRREGNKPLKLQYDAPGEAGTSDEKIPLDWTERTRVTCTYDFTHVRDLMALTLEQLDGPSEELPAWLRARLEDARYRAQLRDVLAAVAEQRERDDAPPVVDWGLWQPLLRLPHVFGTYRPPANAHGTYVAGILAADWRVDDAADDPVAPEAGLPARQVARTGICPELELWDLRVLGDDGKSDEFSVLAALQFVRWVNTQHDHQEINGVNLSFSLQSDVKTHACGGTPVCMEAERLVASGVVVVAAAGNYGRARYVGDTGEVNEGYRVASITDPGNANDVITVGSTHRFEPHSYGVSYFSSRGPTGDGRAKPDLVAPGEKVTAPAPGNTEIELDGTSGAAPHVSGAAALLLCRYPELRGRPAEIKRILCATATDLGRDRYCQGAGLVDILRAMESV